MKHNAQKYHRGRIASLEGYRTSAVVRPHNSQPCNNSGVVAEELTVTDVAAEHLD